MYKQSSCNHVFHSLVIMHSQCHVVWQTLWILISLLLFSVSYCFKETISDISKVNAMLLKFFGIICSFGKAKFSLDKCINWAINLSLGKYKILQFPHSWILQISFIHWCLFTMFQNQYFQLRVDPVSLGFGETLAWMLFVGPTGVYLLDFFCSGIQFNLLLSPYPCFISLLYLDLYVLGDDALIS